MSCGRAVRSADRVLAKASRTKRSSGRGAGACEGGFGGLASIRGECKVAYDEGKGVCMRASARASAMERCRVEVDSGGPGPGLARHLIH